MRRFLISLVSIALLAFSACMFAGCGSSGSSGSTSADNKEALSEAATAELDALKNCDEVAVKELSEAIEAMNNPILSDFSVDSVQLAKDCWLISTTRLTLFSLTVIRTRST